MGNKLHYYNNKHTGTKHMLCQYKKNETLLYQQQSKCLNETRSVLSLKIFFCIFLQKEDLAIRQKTMPTQGLSPLYLIDILVFVKKYIYKKELNYKEKNIYN